jgi:hypothetical protein
MRVVFFEGSSRRDPVRGATGEQLGIRVEQQGCAEDGTSEKKCGTQNGDGEKERGTRRGQ